MTGNELRRIRESLWLRQVDMTEALGVTGNTVARWERGEMAIREIVARLILVMVGGAGGKSPHTPAGGGHSPSKASKRDGTRYPKGKGRKDKEKGSVSGRRR